MGMCTEAGEFQDQLKRSIFYGKSVDAINLAEECGDMLWYIAEALNALGISMESVMEKNIAKLKYRYPEKFNSDDALNRDLEQERKALKG
jgi:NTP pyrophosphatase (non-canonical NTP hydrolase)